LKSRKFRNGKTTTGNMTTAKTSACPRADQEVGASADITIPLTGTTMERPDMHQILPLLQQSARDAARQIAIARQNHEAAAATGSDVSEALDRAPGHREWSLFTGESGRA
jgi:hypothetical protein